MFSSRTPSSSSSSTSRKFAKTTQHDVSMATLAYAAFLFGAYMIYHTLTDGLSSLLTLSAGLQCLSFLLLVLKVKGHSSVSGISARMLGMYVGMLCLRLSSTLSMNGYLPADATGDWAYQCIELLSLLFAAFLLVEVWRVREKDFASQSQRDQDDMPFLLEMAFTCAGIALFLHANLNHHGTWDKLWACACYLETIAMMPQLWMISKAGGEVEALTSHFVVLNVLARMCSLYFWFLAFGDGIGINGNYGEMTILAAHLLQLILSCDFVFVYVKSVGKGAVRLGEIDSQYL